MNCYMQGRLSVLREINSSLKQRGKKQWLRKENISILREGFLLNVPMVKRSVSQL